MARNIEFKAKVRDMSSLLSQVALIAGREPVVINQEDTFFNCPNGRLKLREISDNHGELILYHRPDISGPKTSTYVIQADNLRC